MMIVMLSTQVLIKNVLNVEMFVMSGFLQIAVFDAQQAPYQCQPAVGSEAGGPLVRLQTVAATSSSGKTGTRFGNYQRFALFHGIGLWTNSVTGRREHCNQ